MRAALLKRGELEEARNALRSALFLEPRAWSAEYLLAGVLTREGKTSEATTAFDRALALLEDGPTLIKHVSDCSGIEPLCYTLDEALALCHKRRGSVRVKVRT